MKICIDGIKEFLLLYCVACLVIFVTAFLVKIVASCILGTVEDFVFMRQVKKKLKELDGETDEGRARAQACDIVKMIDDERWGQA